MDGYFHVALRTEVVSSDPEACEAGQLRTCRSLGEHTLRTCMTAQRERSGRRGADIVLTARGQLRDASPRFAKCHRLIFSLLRDCFLPTGRGRPTGEAAADPRPPAACSASESCDLVASSWPPSLIVCGRGGGGRHHRLFSLLPLVRLRTGLDECLTAAPPFPRR